MLIYTWITVAIAGLLLLVSAVSWVVFLVVDDSDWRRLGVKTFRLALVPVLLYVNVAVYLHIVETLM